MDLLKNIFYSNSFFLCIAFNAVPLKCVLVNNQERYVRPEILNINSKEPSFYPHSILVNKCRGSCNNINDSYTKLCISDVVKNMNVKVFNVMSRTNGKRHVSWHKTCKCKRRLDASVCNDKLPWNNNKSACECKELIGKGRCDNLFISTPSICENECHKSCDVAEYLDYANCKCRKRMINKLVEECSEDIMEVT